MPDGEPTPIEPIAEYSPRGGRTHGPVANEGSSQPVVSVVIPTLDAEMHIERCLGSLAASSVPHEIIVVDQSSVDRTPSLAARRGAKVVSLPRPDFYSPAAAARNVGAAHARGTFLLHLDADMEVRPGLLADCVERCQAGDMVAVVVPEVDVAKSFFGRCKALERECYRTSDLEAARFVRTDVFRAVGGYDPSIRSGEDWHVHRRYLSQGAIARADEVVLHHLGALRVGAHLSKKFAYGRSAARFLRLNGPGPIGAAMLAAYWRSRRALVRHPLQLAGLIALRSAEIAAMTLGLATQALTVRLRRR